jgi:hypothetical protein
MCLHVKISILVHVLFENGLGIDAANKGHVASCTLKTI